MDQGLSLDVVERQVQIVFGDIALHLHRSLLAVIFHRDLKSVPGQLLAAPG